MKTIYITYCTGKKDNSFKDTDIKVTPDVLYTSARIKSFIRQCRKKDVAWAIFSDRYSIWFAAEKHIWYDKHPNTVTEDEFDKLLKIFDARLKGYDEIIFYYNPARIHKLYKRLIEETALKDRMKLITHLRDIG